MKSLNIAILGDVILDKLSFYKSNRISTEAPVPIIELEKFEYFPGGASLTARNLNKLGCNVDIFTQIGDDKNGKILNDLLKKINVFNFSKKNYSTILKNRIIVKKEYFLREDTEEIKTPLNNDLINLFKRKINKYDAVVFIDYNKGFLNSANFDKLKKISIENKKTTFMDPHPLNINNFFDISYLKPNLKEAKEITNKKNINTILRYLNSKYNTIPVVTLGKKGSIAYKDEKILNSKIYNSKFVDSSGSGDVFFAHFIESILKEKSLLNSINYASKFATKNVSHFGYDIF